MTDECIVERPSSTSVFDETAGTYEPSAPTVVYAGVCRLRTASARAQIDQQVGGELVVLSSFDLWLPASTIDVRLGDVATITGSDDELIVGESYRVTRIEQRSHLTRRTLGVELILPADGV
ncbi:MAG: hypothetical protein KDB37_05510 [Ilumatobacter sp.]|nr:hypothetical protein [Ilumatobacter sp.]